MISEIPKRQYVKDKGREPPEIEESPDLAYFLGVILGDSCITHGRIIFTVRDLEFRAKIVETGKRIVGKDPLFIQHKSRSRNEIEVRFYSPTFVQALQSWLNFNETSLTIAFGSRSHNSDSKAFVKIYGFVSKSRENAKAFIEGFYDSEGSCCQYKPILRSGRQSDYYHRDIEIYNTNKELLQFTQSLLTNFFNIESKLRLKISKGHANIFHDKTTIATKDCWRLRILTKDNIKKFTQSIQSSIPSKNFDLELL